MMSNFLRYLGPTIGIVAVLITVWILSYIEDWSRDLSINVAETTVDAKDERLRTWHTAKSLADLDAKLQQIATYNSLWSYDKSESPEPTTRKIYLVRTTKIMRFKDDIIVTLRRGEDETIVDVYSKSRVGKGDLGQNPRNIRDLLNYLRN
jgi:uncharacterized protein (DUF1499 family)